MEKIYRLPQVLEQIGMGRAWLYAEIKKKKFPAGVRLGERARGWTASSIDAWVSERVEGGV